MEKSAKELKKPYELLSKNERLLLGFLQDCPKQHTEIISHLKTLKVKERTANNIIKRLEKDRKIFRIKKAGNKRIFYRLNDFPNKIDALLAFLKICNTDNPWDKLFIDKLYYNIISLYPKHELKQILKITSLDLAINYKNYYDILLEALSRIDIPKILGSLKKIRLLNEDSELNKKTQSD